MTYKQINQTKYCNKDINTKCKNIFLVMRDDEEVKITS